MDFVMIFGVLCQFLIAPTYFTYLCTKSNVALSGDPCDVQQCMWASTQPNPPLTFGAVPAWLWEWQKPHTTH